MSKKVIKFQTLWNDCDEEEKTVWFDKIPLETKNKIISAGVSNCIIKKKITNEEIDFIIDIPKKDKIKNNETNGLLQLDMDVLYQIFTCYLYNPIPLLRVCRLFATLNINDVIGWGPIICPETKNLLPKHCYTAELIVKVYDFTHSIFPRPLCGKHWHTITNMIVLHDNDYNPYNYEQTHLIRQYLKETY